MVKYYVFFGEFDVMLCCNDLLDDFMMMMWMDGI